MIDLPFDVIQSCLIQYISLPGLVLLSRCVSRRCSDVFAPLWIIKPSSLPPNYSAFFTCDEMISDVLQSTKAQFATIVCSRDITPAGLRMLLMSQSDASHVFIAPAARRPLAPLLVWDEERMDWKDLAGRMHQIKSLHLSDSFISSHFSRVISSFPPTLTELNVSDSDIDNALFPALQSAAFSLSLLDVSNTFISARPLSLYIVWRGEELQRLGMAGLKLVESEFTHCIPSLCNLTSLDISRNPWITSATTSALACAAKQLLSIDLRHCSSICGRNVQMLISMCVKLEKIQLSHIASEIDRVFDQLSDKSDPRCSQVIATQCSYLSDAALIRFLERNSHVATLRNRLEELELSGCGLLTDASLSLISTCGAQLTRLCLRGCSLLSDRSFIDIATSCRNLRAIDVSKCSSISDISMSALLSNCPHLASVVAYGCRNLSYASIAHISKLRFLEEFHLSEWRDLFSLSSRDFKGCSHLRQLSFQDMDTIGDASINSLLSDLRSLHSIECQRCRALTHGVFEHLRLPQNHQLRAVAFLGCGALSAGGGSAEQTFRDSYRNIKLHVR